MPVIDWYSWFSGVGWGIVAGLVLAAWGFKSLAGKDDDKEERRDDDE